jgi:hypothetical protein
MHLRPEECGFGARMGSSQGCTIAELRVNQVCPRPSLLEVKFELWLLTVSPAGFEPTLTAPEGIAVYHSDLALCVTQGTLGRVWGAEREPGRENMLRNAPKPRSRSVTGVDRRTTNSRRAYPLF